MYDVIAVKLVSSNIISYYSTNEYMLKKNDKVIVQSSESIDFGICVSEIKKESKDNIPHNLPKIVRKATKRDITEYTKLCDEAEKALKYAKKIAKELKLEMNFVDSAYTFEKTQLFFNYTADDRIDFRELARKLAQKYKTRIELRQIGVRDKAKRIGGIGPCGLFLCCNTFLTDFNSVSINMAKNQFLALNPSKINGVCGRLLCCLKYEDDVYTDLKKEFPSVGSIIKTKSGKGKVISIDVFNKKYSVEIEKNNVIDVDVK